MIHEKVEMSTTKSLICQVTYCDLEFDIMYAMLNIYYR